MLMRAGRATLSLRKQFLNPTVYQCPDLLPRSDLPQRSQEMSHSRHEGMSPAWSSSSSRLSWRRSSSVGGAIALTPSLPQFPQLQGGSRNSLLQTQ